MSTTIFEKDGHQIVQYCAPHKELKLEIWAQPWRLTPEQAREIGQALLLWANRTEDLAVEVPPERP